MVTENSYVYLSPCILKHSIIHGFINDGLYYNMLLNKFGKIRLSHISNNNDIHNDECLLCI